jgi:hypothetical protein
MAFTKRNPAAVPTAGLQGNCHAAELTSPRVKPSHEFNQGETPRHHCDSPARRPKSIPELIAGAEFCELADRLHPGKQAGRQWR